MGHVQKLNVLFEQLKRFLAVGLLATAVHFLVLMSCVEFLAMNVAIASATGFLLGLVVNYWLNRNYTFSSTAPHSTTVIRFGAVAGTGLLINTMMMAFLDDFGWLPYLLAQCATTAVVLVWNFLCNALWTFKNEKYLESVRTDRSC